MTRWRGDAPRTERERLRRRDRIGKDSADTREAPGATPPRTTLERPGVGPPEAPELGVLRPLARALIELALVLDHEDEEDE